MLEFGLLGPLELRLAGTVHQVHGYFQKTLLVSLLVSDGHVVPVRSLRYELWGDARPDGQENALQAHVSRLRRKLETLEPHRDRPRLLSGPAGYRLRVDDHELDSRRFLRAVGELTAERATCRPDLLAGRLRTALAAWRGPAFGGVVGGRICRAGGEQLELARLRALCMLFDAELLNGANAVVVAELGALVGTYSALQQRFCEQLMVALYRSGRQTDALDVYRRTSAQLSETGGRPSARLAGCERAILSQDPDLDIPSPRPAGASRVTLGNAARPPPGPAIVIPRLRTGVAAASLSQA